MNSSTHPRLAFLSADQADQIVDEACRVLETTGVLVENQDGLDLLNQAGAVSPMRSSCTIAKGGPP